MIKVEIVQYGDIYICYRAHDQKWLKRHAHRRSLSWSGGRHYFLVLRDNRSGEWSCDEDKYRWKRTAKNRREIIVALTKNYGANGFEVINEPLDCYRSLLALCEE